MNLLAVASHSSALTFRLVLVFACSVISYSPVTRTSLWISSRKHFLELTGKKKEIENTDSIRTGKSSSAAIRAMATKRPTNQPLPAHQLNRVPAHTIGFTEHSSATTDREEELHTASNTQVRQNRMRMVHVMYLHRFMNILIVTCT